MSAFSRRKHPRPDAALADQPLVASSQMVPTLIRRLVAWGLEVTILAASIAGPLYLGGTLNHPAAAHRVELTPVLNVAQMTAARAFGLSLRLLPDHVTPLTNLAWSVALGLPLALAVAHGYSIARYGKSWPKQWLGVQVLALNGQIPGWRRSLLREGVGKWGGPILVAYGLWRITGAFPGILILGGLGLLALIGENLTGLGNYPRRPWHDWLAGTCVVDQETGAIIRLASLWDADGTSAMASPMQGNGLNWSDRAGGLTSVILTPLGAGWGDRRGRSLTISLSLGLLVCVGGLIGIGSHYILKDHSIPTASEDSLYLTLVSTLTNPELDKAERRAAVLALGNLPDDRVTPLLVDLIAQANHPQWLDALQQALTTRGIEAIPYLRRLNRSLTADLAMQGDDAWQRTLIIRLQTVNRILAKLIILQEGDRPTLLDLSHVNLGYLPGGNGDFTLALNQQDLSRTQWRGTILTQAQLRGARFYHPGADEHPDTYDDQTADLSGANLTDADLSHADLTLSRLVGAGLVRVNLNQATLTLADLTNANLTQAQLIQADLNQALLVNTRLSQADLTAAQLSDANLEAARLAGVNAVGAQLSGAILQGVAASAADLTDANLMGATLENADLTGARLQGANLEGANLSQAILKDTDLRGVWLQGADLSAADLAGAILTEPKGASTQNFVADLPDLSKGNRLVDVDFSTTRNLDAEQLTFICTQGGIHPACDVSILE